MSEARPALPASAGIVIIGSGIVGCVAAYHLAKRGLSVVVLERGRIAEEQSSRAWGFVRQQGRHDHEVPIAAEASRTWNTLGEEIGADLEYVRRGILVLAETPEDVARIEDGVRVGARHGLGTKLLAPDEIHAKLPELAGPWRAGIFTEGDGHAEPRVVTEAFARAAQAKGAKFFASTPALAIETAGGRVSGVVTAAGTIRAETVLVTAGVGTGPLLRPLGISLPFQIIRTYVAETRETMPFTELAGWGPYCSFRPTRRRTFYIGTGYRDTGTEYDVTPSSFRHWRYFLPSYLKNWRYVRPRLGRAFATELGRIIKGGIEEKPLPEPAVNDFRIGFVEERFYQLFPHLRGLGLQRRWTGRIDITPDLLPIINRFETPAGLYVGAGFSGHGFALGPVTGRLISELIAEGKPSLDLRAFRASRFEEGDFAASPTAL